jgi:hypothetical protein
VMQTSLQSCPHGHGNPQPRYSGLRTRYPDVQIQTLGPMQSDHYSPRTTPSLQCTLTRRFATTPACQNVGTGSAHSQQQAARREETRRTRNPKIWRRQHPSGSRTRATCADVKSEACSQPIGVTTHPGLSPILASSQTP